MRLTRQIASLQRDDSGNLVAAIVLITVIALLASVTIAAVVPSFSTAHTAQSGEQAVAQANAGLSDALFHLDQMGDAPTSFCAGDPPASLLPSGMTDSSCYLTGSAPVPSAPGVRYYVGNVVTSDQAGGTVQEVALTSYAWVSGQNRTATETVYRVSDSYGIFGVSGFSATGALKNANVFEVGGCSSLSDPTCTPVQGGTVPVGVGPYGGALCTGNSSGSLIVTVGQNGSVNNGCPNWTAEATGLEPGAPTICGSGQTSSPFSPCIDISSFATYEGSTYCPLWGSGIPNTISSSTEITPPQNAVFDCATDGAAVGVGSTSSGCPAAGTLPFHLSSIPPGTYYFDSNNFTVDNLDQCVFAGPVSLFVLPADCSSGACPLYTPTSGSDLVGGGNKCNLPPNANTNVNLTLVGSYVNAGETPVSPFNFTPGVTSNFSLYWSGNNAITPTKGMIIDGQLYAPAAIMQLEGSGYEFYGSVVLNCFGAHGSPNLYFVRPLHAREFLMSWTVTNYRVTA